MMNYLLGSLTGVGFGAYMAGSTAILIKVVLHTYTASTVYFAYEKSKNDDE